MLKQILNLENVTELNKNAQKSVNGGARNRCGHVCYKHGDCCIAVLSSPLGTFEEEGQCFGLQCIPN